MAAKTHTTVKSKPRQAVLHRGLFWLRMDLAEQLDELLTRAAVRDQLVLRLSATEALFRRAGMTAVNKRLLELKITITPLDTWPPTGTYKPTP